MCLDERGRIGVLMGAISSQWFMEVYFAEHKAAHGDTKMRAHTPQELPSIYIC